MSFVDDARKLLQDFVTPELRAITARLDGADQANVGRNKLASERHLALLDKLETNRREILLQIELALAKGKIEELQNRVSAEPAQQIQRAI